MFQLGRTTAVKKTTNLEYGYRYCMTEKVGGRQQDGTALSIQVCADDDV